MELVYLWVEDYKNIQKQGFNFSPRFRCDYDEEKNELTINENKDYVSIFPDNINITAIVGENGSGKSNLLHLIIGSIFQNENNWRNIKGLFFIFRKKKKYILSKMNEGNLPSSKTNYEFKTFYEIKENLYVSLFDFSLIQPEVWNNWDEYKKYYSLEPSVDYRGNGPNGSSKIIPISFNANMSSLSCYFYKHINKQILIDNKIDIYDSIAIKYARKVNIKFLEKEREVILDVYKNKNKVFGITKEEFENKKALSEYVDFKILNLSDEEIDLIGYFDLFFEIELYSTENEALTYKSLSLGHKMLISNLGLILKTIIKRVKDKSVIFLLDEIETSMHPNWQRNIVYLFIKIFKNYYSVYFNFIFASHSPFLLSDLQRENCIFLTKNENKKSDLEKKQTFGANIHTLLSDAFFMSGGLQGKYSELIINEVITYLSSGKETENIKSSKDAQNIINIIGEPIIKRELQRMLKNKMELSNKTEIDTIKNEIKLLTERLEKLEPKDEK